MPFISEHTAQKITNSETIVTFFNIVHILVLPYDAASGIFPGMENKPQIVLSTCPDQKSAQYIATQLVERQLAACVNIIAGIESVYRWKDKVETNNEYLLIIKTQADCYTELENAIQTLHPYELPEVLAVSLEAGLPSYIDWINNNTK